MKFIELINQYKDNMEGGVGDNTNIDSLCEKQLLIGLLIEKEHTNDLNHALEIAIDHVTEDSQYYHKLINSGIVDEEEAINMYKKLYKENNNMKKSELVKLIKEELEFSSQFNEKASKLKSDKLYLKDTLQQFNKISEELFITKRVEEACKKMKKIKESASNVILTEMDDDYDKMILQKNIKVMESVIGNIEKNIMELKKSERRIEDEFDTFGRLIEKYFDVN